MRTICGWVLVLVIAAAPLAAQAAGEAEEQGPRTLAVQNRMHFMRHEFGVWIGVLPLDAFTKGLTFTGAYTLHFSDLVAWEIAEFTYSVGIDTRLADELANLPQPVGPTPFEVVKYYLTSSLLFKPVYAKLAVLNRSLVYGEVFFLLGGGYGWLTITHRPVIDVGVGARVYAGKNVSFRVDFRDYMFFNTEDLENELWIALGISLGFGG